VDKYQSEQNYDFQPEDFCRMHQLSKPHYFRIIDIGDPTAEVYSLLASMAVDP
jgi:hypothetical protein